MGFLQEWLSSMSPAEIAGQIVGIVVIIGCIVNAQFPKRWQILLGQVLLNILSLINMLLLGQGLTACLPCVVASVHCTVNVIRDKKNKPAPIWETVIFCSLYLIFWGIGFMLSVNDGSASALDLITLLATGFFVASVLMPKEQLMRMCSLGNAIAYIVYDIIYQNVAVVAQIFAAVSVIVALIRYHRKKQSDTQNES